MHEIISFIEVSIYFSLMSCNYRNFPPSYLLKLVKIYVGVFLFAAADIENPFCQFILHSLENSVQSKVVFFSYNRKKSIFNLD